MQHEMLKKIAELNGTPVYAYNLDDIQKRATHLMQTLQQNLNKKISLHFAVKSNFCPAVITTLKEVGYGGDVVSIREMHLLMKQGIAARDIIFSGVGKSNEEIRAALKLKIGQINVESPSEFSAILNAAKEIDTKNCNLSLRLRPGLKPKTIDKLITGRKNDKFGLEAETIMLNIKKWRAAWGKPIGIAIHIGSQISRRQDFDSAFTILAAFLKQLGAMNLFPAKIDLGGGIGINYQDKISVNTSRKDPYSTSSELSIAEYAQSINEKLIAPLEASGQTDYTLQFEPGRWLVAKAGYLVASAVRVRKDTAPHTIILDAGMNNLMRPALYNAHHAIINLTQEKTSKQTSYDIFGPICEPGDCFLRNTQLPETSEGDLVAILDCGAYSAVLANNYNLRNNAPEIAFKQQRIIKA